MQIIKTNDNVEHHVDDKLITSDPRVALPMPPARYQDKAFEMEIYAKFMRHLRTVPNSRVEIKILSSLQFTADMMDISDALVSKILVDLGLRAPRKAYPVSFLDFADKAQQRISYDDHISPPLSILALWEHWDKIGDNTLDTLACRDFATYNDTVFV